MMTRTRTPDLYLRGVSSLSLAEYSLVGSFAKESGKGTFWVSPLMTPLASDLKPGGFAGPSPCFLLAEESVAATGELGSSLGFFPSLVLSATGSLSLVFALLQSSLPEGFGLSLDSAFASGIVVETCSFVSERVLPFVICCSALVGVTSFGATLAGTSKVVLDEDAAL